MRIRSPCAGRCRRSRLRAALAAAMLVALFAAGGALSQTLTEDEVKAAYLYNFARFTEWPPAAFASPSAPLRICTIGATAGLDAALRRFEGKAANERALGIRTGVPPDAAADCQLVYLGETESARLLPLRGADGRLVVGEGETALDRGALIALHPVGRRLGFAVDLAAVRRAGLKLPAQMLALAVEVRR